MRTTWLYDDPQHPERVTGTVESPAWTAEDRAALLGLARYESTLCSGCGQPKDVAWSVDGWHKAKSFRCDGCTAQAKATAGSGADRVEDQMQTLVWLDPDADLSDLPPLTLD